MNPQIEHDLLTSMTAHQVPGVSLAYIQKDLFDTVDGYGFVDLTARQPLMRETVFQAASITKPVFAYLVHKLAQAGTIDLDKPLADYLPNVDLRDDPRAALITGRRVLCHMAGLPNWRGKNALKIHITPGERWSYSGEGYVYLQQVVEHLTGQPLNVLLDEQVFKPLKMRSSSVIWRDDYQTLFAPGHDETGKPVETAPMTAANAAYSLYSTPLDLARFVSEIFDDNDTTQAMLALNGQVTVHAPWGEGWDPRMPN